MAEIQSLQIKVSVQDIPQVSALIAALAAWVVEKNGAEMTQCDRDLMLAVMEFADKKDAN